MQIVPFICGKHSEEDGPHNDNSHRSELNVLCC
jgi:hypothetical protein